VALVAEAVGSLFVAAINSKEGRKAEGKAGEWSGEWSWDGWMDLLTSLCPERWRSKIATHLFFLFFLA
jgi:hypothetical protein